MNKEIGLYDAKTKLPDILRRVAAGEQFTITKHGKPIADLIPSRAGSDQRIGSAIANIQKAKKYVVSDETLNEFKNKGRK